MNICYGLNFKICVIPTGMIRISIISQELGILWKNMIFIKNYKFSSANLGRRMSIVGAEKKSVGGIVGVEKNRPQMLK